MIKPMPLSEILKRLPSDPSKLVGLLRQAGEEVRNFPRSEKWQPTGYHTSRGARVEVRPWGRSYRWRLNGYASDGSDAK